MRDLFGVPQPQDSSDTDQESQDVYDGVPFVKLDDDDDVFRSLMDMVYLDKITPPDFEVVDLLPLVRMSIKYDFVHIRNWAQAQLKERLPYDEPSMSKRSEYQDVTVAAQVISMSEECDFGIYLPLAYYALVTSDWASEPTTAHFISSILPQDALLKIISGKTSLTQAVLKKEVPVPENCCTTTRCTKLTTANTICVKGTPGLWFDVPLRWTCLLKDPWMNCVVDWSGVMARCALPVPSSSRPAPETVSRSS